MRHLKTGQGGWRELTARDTRGQVRRMPQLPPVILLDLDDTILRFSAAGNECWEQLCGEHAPRVGLASATLLKAVGESALWYWSDAERHRIGRLDLRAARRLIVGRAFSALGIVNERAANELADAFTVLREELVRPFDGAIEGLRAMRENGARLGLLTNGSATFQRRKIERFDLAPFFELILIEGELGFGKPDVRVFHEALRHFDCNPTNAWMIGDNLEWDIEPAQALGIGDVWVDHAGTGLPAESPVQPSRTVQSLRDVLAGVGSE